MSRYRIRGRFTANTAAVWYVVEHRVLGWLWWEYVPESGSYDLAEARRHLAALRAGMLLEQWRVIDTA